MGPVTINKRYLNLAAPFILALAALSAWRTMAIFGLTLASEAAWLSLWLGLTLGFTLFWLAALSLIAKALGRPSTAENRSQVWQRWLTATLGAGLGGLLGLLLTTPAGLSRLTIELSAENVWTPHMFTLTWVKDGVWEAPFNLPETQATPGSLELLVPAQGPATGAAAAPPDPAAPAGVWLVQASRADGSAIPLDEFQVEQNWQRREINWGAYQQQPVLVAQPAGDSPAVLRWQGVVSGPLTLVFARHSQAGQVTVRWNGTEQRLDLYAPQVEFAGLTLPLAEPAIWRASLPFSALQAEEVSLSLQPDPEGHYLAIITKLRLAGSPGQTLELSGPQLLAALRVTDGQASLTSTGVQVVPDSPRQAPQLFLTSPLATGTRWSALIPPLENSLLILYATVAGVVSLASLARRLPAATLANANMAAVGVIVALLAGEIGLRFYLPAPGQYYAWPPYLHRVFRPLPGVMPGVSGDANFIINSQGIRGDEFSPADEYRILTIGGSTTECLFLDQTETWPQLLQDRLNAAGLTGQPGHVWVGNVGKSGHNTREHLLHMQYLLPQYPELDAVILLIGFNDLSLGGLSQAASDTAGARQALMRRAFAVLVDQEPDLPYYKQTATWRLLDKIRPAQAQATPVNEIDVEDEMGRAYIKRREMRQQAVLEDELPDLAVGLAEYRRNVQQLIDLAETYQVRLILLTQPALYRPDLTGEEESLLWMGTDVGRRHFYTSRAMAEGMALYNQQMLEICGQRQVECLDLATALPKDTTIFYDDVHFTEAGAKQVAEIIANYMLHDAPFAANLNHTQ